MNRLNRNDLVMEEHVRENDDYDDEEHLYERQALINDNTICDDETNFLGNDRRAAIRNRQQMDKTSNTTNGYELRSLSSNSNKRSPINEPQIEFTYYEIQPGDSLQGICLRYACPINQVRRLNGLMTDQDFYGLRRLKLPLGKLGLLEDLLKQNDLLMLENNDNLNQQTKVKNSPGSALSVTTRRNYPMFKPLLSPGYLSDRIADVNRNTRSEPQSTPQQWNGNPSTSMHHNSHSFSSLREFSYDDLNIVIKPDVIQRPVVATTTNQSLFNSKIVQQQNFIKSELIPDPSQITIDTLLTDEGPLVNNIFEDLDYHVEKVKVAAESYDKRAAELVNGMAVSSDVIGSSRRATRVSKIPELFFSGENFGLNIKKLVALIVFVCLVIPLIYMNQTNIFKQ